MRVSTMAAFLWAVAAVGTAVAAAPATTRMQAPLRLDVQGLSRGDVTEVTVTLSVAGRLAAQPVLRLALPPEATLAEGVLEEVVPVPATGGDVVRRFRVRGLGMGRVIVTADAATRASGARAEARWPSADQEAPRLASPRSEPIPPVTVGGVRIDSAIPLDPGRKEDR